VLKPVAIIHVLMLLELDYLRVIFSMICLGIYSLLLDKFPVVTLLSPVFVLSCGKFNFELSVYNTPSR
jgi:Transmembrane adaptor Erv26